MRLNNRAFQILAAMEIRVYALVVLGNSEDTFHGESEDVIFCPSVYCVLVLYGVAVLEQ